VLDERLAAWIEAQAIWTTPRLSDHRSVEHVGSCSVRHGISLRL